MTIDHVRVRLGLMVSPRLLDTVVKSPNNCNHDRFAGRLLFTPDEVLALAEGIPGPIPGSDTLPLRRARSPPDRPISPTAGWNYGDMRRVANPPPMSSIQIAWPPVREPGDQAEAAALGSCLARASGRWRQTSLFARRPARSRRRVALTRRCSTTSTSASGSSFTIVMFPCPASRSTEAEADLWRMVETFLSEGIDPDHFARIRFRIRGQRDLRRG